MEMQDFRVKAFTPINPKKATFFKSLLTFFENTTENALQDELSPKQKEILETLEDFNADGTYIPKYDTSMVSVLNTDIVKQMRPTMHGKIALYDALIAFFDVTLNGEKEHEENCHFNNDNEDNFISTALAAMPSFIGISIISPSVKKEYKEKKEQAEKKNKLKRYTIDVHYDAIYSTVVYAADECEAKCIAREEANNAPLEDLDFDSCKVCITDIREK
jgi:hypothetical protein